MSVPGQPELQQETLRFYGALLAITPVWAGKLVLGVGKGCSTCGFPVSASLNGAASLLLEQDASESKAALREGSIDFLVSTVDEALRTLKNEIRRSRPLAVAIAGGIEAAVAELQDRGVVPDLLFTKEEQSFLRVSMDAWRFVRRLESSSGDLDSVGFSSGAETREFNTYSWSLPARADSQALDQCFLQVIPEDDVVRRRWIHGIARYQRSGEGFRAMWLTMEEWEQVNAMLLTRRL